MSEARWYGRWHAAWQRLAVEPPPDAECDALLSRYDESQRHYHTLRHLDECFARLEGVLAKARRPGEVAVALFYHDAVYDPHRADNEARSADLAMERLKAQGATPDVSERVRALIMATRHDALPDSPDAALLVDVDLGIFAAGTDRFDEYEREVTAEYAYVPRILFKHKRREILQAFLARPRIYTSGAFDVDEARARQNIERAIARL